MRNYYGINKNHHYFILMHPLESAFGIIFWTSSNTRKKWVECEIIEDNYKVDDNYKVQLRSIESGYGNETYYQSDFEQLLKEGFIIEKTREDQHVEEIKWFEHLCGSAYLVTSGYVVV